MALKFLVPKKNSSVTGIILGAQQNDPGFRKKFRNPENTESASGEK